MLDLPLTPESFRTVASRYATSVTVITTQSDGFDHAMTATSFTTVSLDPMLVLVCVESNTRFRDALVGDNLEAAVGQPWAVNVLHENLAGTASWFATKGRPLHGQFDRVRCSRGSQTGLLMFDEALSAMEVETTQAIEMGDHIVVVGKVLSLKILREDVDEESERPADWPLTYWARRYRNLSH